MPLPRLVQRSASKLYHGIHGLGYRLKSSQCKPFSRLVLVDDGVPWVLREELNALRDTANTLGYTTVPGKYLRHSRHQCAWFGDQLLAYAARSSTHQSQRIGFSFFHGRPGQGIADFDAAYDWMRSNRDQIGRIRYSQKILRCVLMETGIDSSRLFYIPIGVDIRLFTPVTPASRTAVRRELGIPETAFVIGSFQKDGCGWGDGLEPKRIKGPDVFLDVLRVLKPQIPHLHVLLSGPARGYVKQGLESMGIPYCHRYLDHYQDVVRLYHALDLYLVTSREEGGPKAVLESMATGIPLVTTRVGQAVDLVEHGVNGWLADVEDVNGIAESSLMVASRQYHADSLVQAGFSTAQANNLQAQTVLWGRLLNGFVSPRAGHP